LTGAPVKVTSKQGPLTALYTESNVEKPLVQALSVGGTGAAALPQLMAQLAVRVAGDVTAGRTTAHQIVLVPPRNIDVAPAAAAATIVATTGASWSHPAALSTAAKPDGKSVAARTLVAPPARAPALASSIVASIEHVRDELPALTSMLGGPTKDAGDLLLAELPPAMQRLESAAWTVDAAAGVAHGIQLTNVVTAVRKGVFIVKPASGTYNYTLASNTSPLPLTVENDLDYEVVVVIHVQALNGLPGFHANDRQATIEPHSKVALRVNSSLDRSGRIFVQASLRTPSGAAVGDPVRLSVRTTALGRIGLIITIVSGAVLALALIRRFWRRYRHRGAPPPAPTPDLAPVPDAPAEPTR
jgi:hypothetical protein